MMDRDDAPEPCRRCRFYPLEIFGCCRWRLEYAANELKKTIPIIRRTALENMTCRDYATDYGTEGGEETEK